MGLEILQSAVSSDLQCQAMLEGVERPRHKLSKFGQWVAVSSDHACRSSAAGCAVCGATEGVEVTDAAS